MATTYDDGSWDTPQDPNQVGGDQSGAPSGVDKSAWIPQIKAWYAQYLGPNHVPTDAEIQSHMGNPGGLAGIQQAIQGSDEAKAYTASQAAPQPSTNSTPEGGTDPGSVLPPGAPGLNDYFDKPFTPRPPVDVPGSPTPGTPYIPPTPTPGPTPNYTPPSLSGPPLPGSPAPFSYADYAPGKFTAPTLDEALNDPGYQFRVGEGAKNLDRSAAARGVLNTGGTLKDAINYGQNAASQEYQNVWNRDYNSFNTNEGDRFNAYMANRSGALQAYNTNYGTQYVDPYNRAYQQFTDTTVNPAMAAFGANVGAGNAAYQTANADKTLGYATQAAAGQHQTDMNYLNDFNLMNFDYNKQRNYQNDVWNRLFSYAQA